MIHLDNKQAILTQSDKQIELKTIKTFRSSYSVEFQQRLLEAYENGYTYEQMIKTCNEFQTDTTEQTINMIIDKYNVKRKRGQMKLPVRFEFQNGIKNEEYSAMLRRGRMMGKYITLSSQCSYQCPCIIKLVKIKVYDSQTTCIYFQKSQKPQYCAQTLPPLLKAHQSFKPQFLQKH
ncbi:Hypothetical_protein [Hexamita inflata]|uniref:Hypothetical_protein n=1 Tax=Hexamita inflata TaxID=28002 RepID=A0ABP1JHK4_9EUKA